MRPSCPAISGASGALYAQRFIQGLVAAGVNVHLVVSPWGRRLLRDELGETAAVDKLTEYLVGKYGESIRNGSYTLYSNKDLGAKIASGSRDRRAPSACST